MPSLYLHRFSIAFTVVTFLSLCLPFPLSAQYSFDFTEATVDSIQAAFRNRSLTSFQLVRHYLSVIENLNPSLRAVIEVNWPDVVTQAVQADLERERYPYNRNRLHGIPILLKDNIGTADKINTTAGSFALLGSVVSRDSGVVRRLRKVGAVICARPNPYVASASPCGSSSASAIAAAANLATVTLGTETDGSILCPAAANSVVGIKPTVGLTSCSMVIPISPRQDTIGPICRTVRDAMYVLDAIVGYDVYDSKATKEAVKYIPKGGYRRFLNFDGLRGKRIGILREGFFSKNSVQAKVFEQHFSLMRYGIKSSM
ncbi:Glutamyl-tRNA(Gln) amidotransferase subunit A [Rhynchospora pubera]|uniref:Glutamyl-tRNA(Gln) amidotransferase subunit A n=1 Tax=Rhynchospora pubera TaxID=906938 RepID=A0AAV8F5V2_9POAL|nr:Glutamyl-tRNA(Gln) amidotransferase subunit A [Rhynchospora pubera]